MLRPPVEQDKYDRLKIGRHPEFCEMVGGNPAKMTPLTEADVEQWFERVKSEQYNWSIEFDGCCIGNARLHNLDQENKNARYSIGIFDQNCWGKGYGEEATRLILDYAFNHLFLHRVSLRVLSSNKRGISCYRKCGFVTEGTERESLLVGNEWKSDVMMSILETEYRSRSE